MKMRLQSAAVLVAEQAKRFALWPRRASVLQRGFVLALGIAIIIVSGLLVADHIWRDNLPRSTIALFAVAASLLFALWLFGSSGWKTALAILSAIGAIFVTAGGAFDLEQWLPDGPPELGALVDCPDFPEGRWPDGYVAETAIGYTLVRAEPNLESPVLRKYPPGCHLAFVGYCLGTPKDDWRFDVQDPVWFRLGGGDGYVPAADIRAGPAQGGPALTECPHGEPAPRPPEITAPRGTRVTGPVEIAAAAPGAIQVGFAVYYPDVAGQPASTHWHQIGVDLNTGDGITATWDSRSVPGQGSHRPASVTVLAVPCLGLEFPAADDDLRTYIAANGGGPIPAAVRPPASEVAAGKELACENVDR